MSSKTEYPILQKAPIEVAILEVRYLVVNSTFKVQDFSRLHAGIKDKYSSGHPSFHRDIAVQERPDGTARATITNSYIEDFKFISKDQKKTLLTTPTLFNLNVSGKYENWHEFIAEFQFLWTKLIDLVIKVDSIVITGVSVRFINRFEFDDFSNPTDYFKTAIYAEEGTIPDTVATYLLRYVVKIDDTTQINVTQGLEPPVSSVNPYVFDIDVIHNSKVDIGSLWEIFEKLHDIKNHMFFSNLTEKTIKTLI